ncbi:MAG: 50S ribosomal protein L18 [Chloroflexota bacterium]
MRIQKIKLKRRLRRKAHIRKSIFGSVEKPRLSIFKSGENLFAQIINDVEGKTLISSSTIAKDLRAAIKPGMNRTEQSKLVGADIAKKALAASITHVAFDRNGNLYHGRVKAFADAARNAGLQF